MRKFRLLTFIVCLLNYSAFAQISSYYRNGQSIPITLSQKVMVVKFLPGTSNAVKSQIISSAQVDLLNGTLADVPDIVKLKSRILQHQVWFYPCGIPPIEDRMPAVDSTKHVGPAELEKCNPPCPPPDCTPYLIWQSYDNFYDALLSMLSNANVRSASQAIVISEPENRYTGTCEDFFIKIKPGFTINDFTTLLNYYSLTAVAVPSLGNTIYKVSESVGGSRFCIERANIFFQTGKCDYSTPNFYDWNTLETNDPLWNLQWNLSNTGQYPGVTGADIRAVNAWPLSKGNNIKVAVIDEGVELNHRDLQGNLLPGMDLTGHNTNGGIAGGYFETHGTGVAGIIAAVADNGFDIAGVAPLCKIIPVKAFHGEEDDRDPVLHSRLAEAVTWAYSNGADVINCSWGLAFPNDLLENAINAAASQGRGGLGCIVVVASGNDDENSLGFPENLPTVIATGGMSMCNKRKSGTSCDPYSQDWGSDYGNELSIMAPGVTIRTIPSLAFNYTANYMNGTSAAAPHVSGIAALVLAMNPNLTRDEVRRILEYSCNRVGNYCYEWTSQHPHGPWHPEMGYGRVNAYNAVQLARPGVTISSPTYNVPSQTTTEVTGYIGIIFTQETCPTSLPMGVQYVRRQEVKTNITFPFTNNPVIICSSNGLNLSNPNDGRHWAEAINVTNTTATLRTYVYNGHSSNGQYLGSIPTAGANIKFNYTVIGSPLPVTYEHQRGGMVHDSLLLASIPFKLELDSDVRMNDLPVSMDNYDIRPNPVMKEFTLTFNSELNKSENVEIYSLAGIRLMSFSKRRINKGITTLSFDVSSLPAGVYVVKIGTIKQKFVKL